MYYNLRFKGFNLLKPPKSELFTGANRTTPWLWNRIMPFAVLTSIKSDTYLPNNFLKLCLQKEFLMVQNFLFTIVFIICKRVFFFCKSAFITENLIQIEI